MLKRTYSKKLNQPSQKRIQNIQDEKKIRAMMLSIFMDIWMERPHKSEVSGRWLGQEALSTFFHHILPKSKYPEGIFDKQNIILLTFDEHQKVEQDPSFYEEVNKRRSKLKEKYDRT